MRAWSGEISSQTAEALPSSSSSVKLSPASIVCSRRTGLASSREERKLTRSLRDCSFAASRASVPIACSSAAAAAREFELPRTCAMRRQRKAAAARTERTRHVNSTFGAWSLRVGVSTRT